MNHGLHQQNEIKSNAQELSYALQTRGAAGFIRELLELHHSHLYLAKAIFEGRLQEAKESALCDLKRATESCFLITQIAEVMERADNLSRSLRT